VIAACESFGPYCLIANAFTECFVGLGFEALRFEVRRQLGQTRRDHD
jgi:hypothetical protein